MPVIGQTTGTPEAFQYGAFQQGTFQTGEPSITVGTAQSLDSNVLSQVGSMDDDFYYIQYDAPYLYTSLDGGGQFDRIPSFIFLGGEVHYKRDAQGNVLAMNYNADGSWNG